MKNPRGSAIVWVLVLLVVIVAAGTAYWYGTQNSAPASATAVEVTAQSQTTNAAHAGTDASVQAMPAQNTSAAATIAQSSLVSTPNVAPKLRGTVSGTQGIAIYIWRGTTTPPQSGGSLAGPYVWAMSSSQRNSDIILSGGTWSTTIGNSVVAGNGFDYSVFSAGTYTVAVYDDTTGGNLLTTGTLTIK